MKAIIATAAGVLGLGGLFLVASGRTTNAQSAPQTAEAAAANTADRPTFVNCGPGRQAAFYAHPRANGLSQVECVAAAPVAPANDPYARSLPLIDNGSLAMSYAQPVGQYAPAAPLATRTVVEERVVYRDRPVTRTSRARSQSPSYRRASSSPSYRTEPVRQGRTWKKSAVIIGGSTAGGAGVGAVLGGKSGAKKGAVVGLVGGTIYDVATRNK